MVLDETYFRYSLLFQFQLGHTVNEAYKNICFVFGYEAPTERTCRNWFNRFRSGNFSIHDIPHPDPEVKLESDQLLALVISDPRLSTREMGNELGFSHEAIRLRLLKLDFVQKLGRWIPRQLSDLQKSNRISVCSSLLHYRGDKEWIKQIVTGGEKWVLYVNHARNHQWTP